MSNDITTIPEITLTEMDGVPRARDIAIGERLGYERPRAIRQTIERNKAELEAFGPLATVCGKSRGQDYVEYWLNEEQALLIATLSDAPNAPAVYSGFSRGLDSRASLAATASLESRTLPSARN